MVQCPDCKSTSVQSKGYRGEAKRYLCNSCGRNFTVKSDDESNKKIVQQTQVAVAQKGKKEVEMADEIISGVTSKDQKANQTLNVRKSTKDRLMSMKIYERETVDDIISRLIESIDCARKTPAPGK